MVRIKPARFSAGQALAEFALILPLIMLLFAAVIDYGYALLINISLHTAVREGAQLAVYDPSAYTETQIRDHIIRNAYGVTLTAGNISVNRNLIITSGSKKYKSFKLSVNHTHTFLVPFVFLRNQTSINLSSSVQSLICTGLLP